ncbi:hypothetical protein [Burkholderia dolosa]|uniref:hypothetical protein n=1 Tax=Burkholderia dolosa TaxID=152500 RepID=UPI001C93F3FF|nr:hypothetical protein [Burkholderia dolosa]
MMSATAPPTRGPDQRLVDRVRLRACGVLSIRERGPCMQTVALTGFGMSSGLIAMFDR